MADSFRFSRLYPLLWLFCYCFVCAMTSIIHKRTPTDEDKDVRVKKVGKVLHHNHSFDNRIVSFPQNREHKKHCHFSNLKWLNYALPPFRLNHWIRSTILNFQCFSILIFNFVYIGVIYNKNYSTIEKSEIRNYSCSL